MHTLEKSWGFIKKAGTIILVASIVIWMLSYFPAGVEYGSQESAIGTIGTVIAPVFAPLGFGEWQPAVALAFGLVAKEVVVGTFSSLPRREPESPQQCMEYSLHLQLMYLWYLYCFIFLVSQLSGQSNKKLADGNIH